MDTEKLYECLIANIKPEKIRKDEPMKNHTTFQIGGKADIYAMMDDTNELGWLLKKAKEYQVPVWVLGNGSNVLIMDKGIRGIVIKPNFTLIHWEDTKVTVGAGVKLPFLAQKALDRELSGLEPFCGIPASIGGAVRMNAGAYGGQMQDIVLQTTYMDLDGNMHTITDKEHEFSYRHTKFCTEQVVIIQTVLQLQKEKKETIQMKMEQNRISRREKQPISMPSAGSFFKRGEDFIPAQLIDQAGLKGTQIGGAQISALHAGFIVNTGGATAQDVLQLATVVQKKIKEKYQKQIELEVEIIGEK